jgi:hypothetical protein
MTGFLRFEPRLFATVSLSNESVESHFCGDFGMAAFDFAGSLFGI